MCEQFPQTFHTMTLIFIKHRIENHQFYKEKKRERECDKMELVHLMMKMKSVEVMRFVFKFNAS